MTISKPDFWKTIVYVDVILNRSMLISTLHLALLLSQS